MTLPVFRFAPSPNGALHLGHAYSALLNFRMSREAGGRFLLRIEDIDITRCTPQFEKGIYRDLSWLGLTWEEPVRRQSEHFSDYVAALEQLVDAGVVYPSFLSRSEVRAYIANREADGTAWPRDPDGAPLYPPLDKNRPDTERKRLMNERESYAWRLDMEAARAHLRKPITWDEEGTAPKGETGLLTAHPEMWGDVVIARKEMPASYHLSVVVDDALQNITHVVRGRDLFHATAVHRLLQELLGLPVPRYYHHALIVDEAGRKLSKSRGDTGIAALREAGTTPGDIYQMVDLGQAR